MPRESLRKAGHCATSPAGQHAIVMLDQIDCTCVPRVRCRSRRGLLGDAEPRKNLAIAEHATELCVLSSLLGAAIAPTDPVLAAERRPGISVRVRQCSPDETTGAS